ncbi:hypothetical protein Tco_0129345 [Tanacetum coccineum]
MSSYSFLMAQQIIPAAQLVPKFQRITRCNNYDVLQSIPCSLECKINGQIFLDHPLSYALTATAAIPAVYLLQFWKKVLETPKNLFVAPVNIEIIESFMHTVGYQGVVDKKKDVIQYPRFKKLIIANLMKKFPSISSKLEEDYHSIKDDIPLVSVYTIGNVIVRGMLILDAFLTKEVRATDEYKEYETVFVNVDSLWEEEEAKCWRDEFTIKSLKITIKQKKVVEGNKDVESYADKFDASMIHDDVDDFGDRTEPMSHKEHTEVVDDDDNKEEKKDEKEGDEMGSLE